MHAYATDAKERNSTPIWLAAAAVAATLILNNILQVLNLKVPWWIDAPSVMGFYGLLYRFFDNYLWRLKLGSVRFSEIPNLRGTWVGVVRSSYQGGTEVRGILLYIHETWSNISVQLETETSRSYSIMAAVNIGKSAESGLKYEYMNEPSALSLHTMQPHRGTTHLRLTPDGITLKGDYFNNRNRQTYGELVFRLVSRKNLTRTEALNRASSFLASL